MADAPCIGLNNGRRRSFWTTRESCGTYEVCGSQCAIPGLEYETVDITPPAPPVIVSVAGAASGSPTNDNTPLITGTAEGESYVTILDGSAEIGRVRAAANGTWSFETKMLTEGLHSFTATAADVAGNVSVPSAPFSIIVDTIPPLAPVISSGPIITNNPTPLLDGIAEPNSTVTIYDGAVQLGTTLATGGVWSFLTATLSDGVHTFTATATDAATNLGPASTPRVLTIDTVAPAAPVITLVSADAGVVDNGGSTNDASLVMSGTAEANSTVNIYDGPTPLGFIIAAAGGTWVGALPALAGGTHVFTATAKDAATNVGPASASYTVIIDLAAPPQPVISVVTDDVPPATGTVASGGSTNDKRPTLSGTAEAASTVNVYDGPTLLGTVIATGGAWSFTPTADLVAGAHSFTVTATDAVGNTSVSSTAYTVTVTEPPAWVKSAYPVAADPSLVIHFDENKSWVYGGADSTALTPLTVVRNLASYAENLDGTWTQFAVNVGRRTDKGLLVEEQRVNSLRNNSMQGAVIGVLGSGGALPTNWVPTLTGGLSVQVVGITPANGVDTLRLRFFGTPAATTNNILYFDAANGIPATPGQIWAFSMFLRVQAGLLTNIGGVQLSSHELDAAQAFLRGNTSLNVTSLLTAVQTRFELIGTALGASTAFLRPIMFFSTTAGQAIDVTFDIGWPQLELGGMATSPIRTTGAAVTRPADGVVGALVAAAGAPGSLFADYLAPNNVVISKSVLQIDDGAFNNRAIIRAASTVTGIIQAGGVTQASVPNTSPVVNQRERMAFAFATNDFAASRNGAAVATDTIGTVPALTTLRVGHETSAGTLALNGYVKRIAYFPARLSNADLVSLSTVVLLTARAARPALAITFAPTVGPEPEGRTIKTDDWLKSLMLNILNTRARTDLRCPSPAAIFGHWSESYRNDGLWVGSRLWNAAEKKHIRIADAINAIKAAIAADMGKLIVLDLADSVDVQAEYAGRNSVKVAVTAVKTNVRSVLNLSGTFVQNTWVWQ